MLKEKKMVTKTKGFLPEYQIAWIIEDVTTPLTSAKRNKRQNEYECGQASLSFEETDRQQASAWVSELRQTLSKDFGFSQVTESINVSISELQIT